MGTHGRADYFYVFCTKFGVTVVWEVINSRDKRSKIWKNKEQHAKSQFFVRDRALQYSRLRSAGNTKCICELRAQKIETNFISVVNPIHEKLIMKHRPPLTADEKKHNANEVSYRRGFRNNLFFLFVHRLSVCVVLKIKIFFNLFFN